MLFWTSLILRLVLFSFELHGVSFCLNFYMLNFCHFFYSEGTTISNLYWSIFLIQPFFLSRTDEYMFEKRVLERMYVWFCTERVLWRYSRLLSFWTQLLRHRPQNKKLYCWAQLLERLATTQEVKLYYWAGGPRPRPRKYLVWRCICTAQKHTRKHKVNI